MIWIDYCPKKSLLGGTAGYMHGTAGYMVVAYSILVSAPVHFGFRSYWDLVGVKPTGLGLGDRA